jgi:hypothetical protein
MKSLRMISVVFCLALSLVGCEDNGKDQPPPKPKELTPLEAATGDLNRCKDPELVIFDNMNTDAVLNGGQAPSFDTTTFGTSSGTSIKSRRYCLIRIETYHWNNSKGTPPGKVGLTDANGQQVPPGPWQATGSAGQGGAPNVNWSAPATNPTPGGAVLIHGEYKVNDSSPLTWSGNAKAGKAFARVVVKEYEEGP